MIVLLYMPFALVNKIFYFFVVSFTFLVSFTFCNSNERAVTTETMPYYKY